MGNRFVGDIGDFVKYGLLRALTKGADGPARRLGVVWYANSDDPKTTSGRKTAYLENNASYLSCDPELYASLREMVCLRSTNTLRDRGLRDSWAQRTRFLDKNPLPGRLLRGPEWLDGALEEMDGCGLVFMDPDNGPGHGLACQRHCPAWKHAYESEVPPGRRPGGES